MTNASSVATAVGAMPTPPSALPSTTPRSSNRPLSTTAGTDSRNEKRAAATRSKPRNSPAVIVAPERETPGMSASAWAKPMTIASRRVSVSIGALAARDLLGDEQQQAEHDERRADDVEVAGAVLDLVAKREAEDARSGPCRR